MVRARGGDGFAETSREARRLVDATVQRNEGTRLSFRERAREKETWQAREVKLYIYSVLGAAAIFMGIPVRAPALTLRVVIFIREV